MRYVRMFGNLEASCCGKVFQSEDIVLRISQDGKILGIEFHCCRCEDVLEVEVTPPEGKPAKEPAMEAA